MYFSNKKTILEKIEDSLISNSNEFTSMGVTNGIGGVSLYFYYKWKLEKSEYSYNKILEYIQKALDGITEDYRGNNIIQDIIEIGVLLNKYAIEKIISEEQFFEYNEHYSNILKELLAESIALGNFSTIDGAIFFSRYFINTNQYYDYFHQILNHINDTKIVDIKSEGYAWKANINRGGQQYIEFGIIHGVAGIANYLISITNLNINDKDRNLIYELINGAYKFLVYYLCEDCTVANFPFALKYSDENDKTINLAYGDLGILHVLIKISEILNIKTHKILLTKKLSIISRIKTFENFKDANLLYGVSGFLSFYMILYRKLINKDFILYWKKEIYNYSKHSNKWAGYESFFNKYDKNTPLSLSNGLVGIGSTLIYSELKSDKSINYLDFLNY